MVTSKNTSIPILSAQCGLFGVQDDFFEEYLSLDSRFVKNKKSTFFFRAQGASMSPLIYPNDVLVVDRSIAQKNGLVCVFTFEDRFICKRYFKTSTGIVLRSENRTFEDLVLTEEMNVVFWGVVRAIARDTL